MGEMADMLIDQMIMDGLDPFIGGTIGESTPRLLVSKPPKLSLKYLQLNYSLIRWKTKDGKIFKIKDISDRHLENILNYIKEEKGNWKKYYSRRKTWIKFFEW
jgi:hypothetical protein